MAKSKAAKVREWIHHNFTLLDDTVKKLKGRKYILGMDFSITSTGYVVLDLDGNLVESGEVKTSVDDGTIQQRLWKISEEFTKIVKKYPCVIFSYEMISVFTNPQSAVKLAMVLAQAYNSLADNLNTYPYVVSLATTSLKKAATGNGRADKNLILKAVLKNWGEDFESDDVADAYVAGRVALDIIAAKEIYFKLHKKYGEDLDQFLRDLKKFRHDELQPLLEEYSMTIERFEVVISLMEGHKQTRENDYGFYQEKREEVDPKE